MAKMNKKSGTQGKHQTEGGGQASGSVHDEGSSFDLPDVFCSLGSLIVEGRLPAEGLGANGRGYYEGPHVELPGKISRHKCSQNEYLCNKNENVRKHMLLLWQNNVPMSIEILLCSDCRVGQAKSHSLEVTTVPEPGSILLEQWTVAVQPTVHGAVQMNSLSLLQAVRSYLHFSQLSAWYSTTGGKNPLNVLIRITIPGEEFASKFTRPPEKHFFPPACAGGNSSIAVSVRSLPRTDDIPKVLCAHKQQAPTQNVEEEEDTKLGIAGALAWRDPSDLRRSLVKAKLASADALPMLSDCPGRLIKSDSMDSMLSDSLIDPPQSLAKMTPRRYQSPSRCGSPSLEAPEPLMGLRMQDTRNQLPSYEQTVALKTESDSPDSRLNRHDLMRRRDLSLFQDLHPRLFHGHPRLSLPPRTVQTGPRRPMNTIPCRALACDEPSTSSQRIMDDRMPIRCTISGKHICQFEEELEELRQSPPSNASSNDSSSPESSQHPCGDQYKQAELGAKQKGWTSRLGRTSTPYSRDSSSDSSQADPQKIKFYKPLKDADCSSRELEYQGLDIDLSQSEMDDVLHTLRSRNSPISQSKERRPSIKEDNIDELIFCSKSRRSSLEEIFDPQHMKQEPKVSQVFRADLSPFSPLQQPKQDKGDILLGAISRQYKSRPDILQPEIHSLRETSKYCSQSSSSSSDISPISPIYTQLFESEQANQTPSPKDETDHNEPPWNDFKPRADTFVREMRRSSRSPSPALFPPVEGCDDINVGDLCHELEKKCLISRKIQYQEALNKENFEPSNVDYSTRSRSYSDTFNLNKNEFDVKSFLRPLDFSFDDFDDTWSLTEESVEKSNNSNLHTSDKRRISIDEDNSVPSANKKNAFRKSFDSATSMVFQSRTGLPLTSSPAPMRRGIKFDFDSGINTPKDIKRALFEAQSPEESECGSPKKKKRDPRKLLSTSAPATISGNNLLGNFEESVLNGRLEPVSTVEGFTAEIGASGSFHPKHLTFPVTVFFYTLCENSNVASPYLGHINLGKKGYRVPDKGTLQLTLFNPLGTVVKMFVVMYDLSDMPPNSQTFLRQRTLYMPSDQSDSHEDAQKWLRYLIHLRLASSKSGKIYLHTDVRMIIFRKSDLDTATDHEAGKGFELRSFTRGPTNPKFSPRK
eukprot:GFUD01013033.1.p1 GENE.GFUD01013033.1~~GFUD01013033.1.p1  ORF type:complete len:1150 (+),score=174.33 GFUD01013033.1:469-3918(+)